ncbi:MAG: hypothetical protein M0C28_36995 [Candidatus Moduliflexus flocculans]|nr:hypothetical protein [Candidatus Moduliflexus flocculans]
MRTALLAVFVASALAASGARAQEKKKPEPPPGWQAKPFSLENPSADFKIALKGYVQADFRSYLDWTAGDEDTGEPARGRVRVAPGAHRHRGRVEAALVRGGRRPRVRRGGRAEGRVGRPAAPPGRSRSAAGTSSCR